MSYTLITTDGQLELHKDGCQHINHGKRRQAMTCEHRIIGTGLQDWDKVADSLESWCGFVSMQYEMDGVTNPSEARKSANKQVWVSPCAKAAGKGWRGRR